MRDFPPAAPNPYNAIAMLDALLWLATIEVIGFAAFPIVHFLLPKLADRGYGFGKTFGVLLVGYAAWILSVLGAVPSVRGGLVALVAALVVGGAFLAHRNRAELAGFFSREWRLVVVSESVFVAAFLAWTLFRAYDPAISHTEQPMDFMFLNASIRSEFGQPMDAWMAGETVSYYYFGYWMMGALSEISGVASNVSYNLAMALVPALAACGAVSLASGLVRADGALPRVAIGAGIFSAVALVLASNLAGALEFVKANAIGPAWFYDWLAIEGLDGPAETPTASWAPDEHWWWFRATRIINTFQDGAGIDYTIQEFPFFSFILGDLHPHVMAIPFVLLFAAFAFGFFASGETALRELRGWRIAALGAMGLTLGGVAFSNLWDFPMCAALLVGIAAVGAYSRIPVSTVSPASPGAASASVSADGSENAAAADSRRRVLRLALAAAQIPLAVIALAFLLYLPYYIGFAGSVNGIGAVEIPSRWAHLFIVWAVPLGVVAPWVVASFWRTVVEEDWRRLAAVSLAVALLPFVAWMALRLQSSVPIESPAIRLIRVLPLAALAGMGAWAALFEASRNGRTARAFALSLATIALALIMTPELIRVDDFFGPPSERMNTVFKLYYHAWILLAAVGGFCLYDAAEWRIRLAGWRRRLSTLWMVSAAALLILGFYYTAAGAASKAGGFASEPTLDGLDFVRDRTPGEYGAIMYMRDNAEEGAVVLELVGEYDSSGMISRGSGVPNVINWPGHELQWRGGGDGSFSERQSDVAAIYSTQDIGEARNLLAKYNVNYVYAGPREAATHPAGMAKFAEFMDVAFESGGAIIYKLRE